MKSFDYIKQQMTARRLRPFLTYPAILEIRKNRTLLKFHTVIEAEACLVAEDNYKRRSPVVANNSSRFFPLQTK
jgi:hypothetical protein